MKILGIETSCDETAAAIIEDGTKIISNVVATSQDMHAKTGGVIPESAAREQVKSIIPVINEALKNNKIDTIAITIGPGLIGSLLVGVETAKTISYLWNKPIIPVNHLVGHIYANWLGKEKPPEFPALALVVSGGHTDLVLMKNHGNIKYIGGTRDDAAGEAFDKTARLLDLPYPGGPNLAKLAEKFLDKNPNAKLNLFPRPMVGENNFEWSFSGLKTAVLREVGNKKFNDKEKSELAAEIQEAIVDSLVIKVVRAIEKYKPKSFLLSGGVAANKRLSVKLSEKIMREMLHIPNPQFCTDNAAYIAGAAYFNNKPANWKKISANPELTITD